MEANPTIIVLIGFVGYFGLWTVGTFIPSLTVYVYGAFVVILAGSVFQVIEFEYDRYKKQKHSIFQT